MAVVLLRGRASNVFGTRAFRPLAPRHSTVLIPVTPSGRGRRGRRAARQVRRGARAGRPGEPGRAGPPGSRPARARRSNPGNFSCALRRPRRRSTRPPLDSANDRWSPRPLRRVPLFCSATHEYARRPVRHHVSRRDGAQFCRPGAGIRPYLCRRGTWLHIQRARPTRHAHEPEHGQPASQLIAHRTSSCIDETPRSARMRSAPASPSLPALVASRRSCFVARRTRPRRNLPRADALPCAAARADQRQGDQSSARLDYIRTRRYDVIEG